MSDCESNGPFLHTKLREKPACWGCPLLLSCSTSPSKLQAAPGGVRAEGSLLFKPEFFNFKFFILPKIPVEEAGEERDITADIPHPMALKEDLLLLCLLGLRRQFLVQQLSKPCFAMAQQALPQPSASSEVWGQPCTLSFFPESFKHLCAPKGSPGARGAGRCPFLHPGCSGRPHCPLLPIHALLATG